MKNGAGCETRTHEGLLRRLTKPLQSPLCETSLYGAGYKNRTRFSRVEAEGATNTPTTQCLNCITNLVRVERIELSSAGWQPAILPFNYTRNAVIFNSSMNYTTTFRFCQALCRTICSRMSQQLHCSTQFCVVGELSVAVCVVQYRAKRGMVLVVNCSCSSYLSLVTT